MSEHQIKYRSISRPTDRLTEPSYEVLKVIPIGKVRRQRSTAGPYEWVVDGIPHDAFPSRDKATRALLTHLSPQEPEDTLAARLRRAVARLEERRDKASGLELMRLSGKIEGVKLAASYIQDQERIFEAVRHD